MMRHLALVVENSRRSGADLQYLLGDHLLAAAILEPGGRRRL